MKYLMLFVFFGLQVLFSDAQDPHPISGVNMKKNSRWPSQLNDKTVIEVSWDNPSSLNAQERAWVKSAVEATWETYANIDFTGWGASTYSSGGIRIAIDPGGWPHTKGLGTALEGVPGGMLLTFDFQGTFQRPIGFSREECIKFIAVHEFGHALGLAHEQNRWDCVCNENPQGTNGDFYVTPCDLLSVMNYCNPKWSNYGKLSANDIIGIQVIYGKPQSTSASGDLDEIRLIPCTINMADKLRSIKKIVNASSSFVVKSFTEESKAVPQTVADKFPNGSVTIRFFHPDDQVKSLGLKKLLVSQGYNSSTITVEDMSSKMSAPIPGYIEIWTKEQTITSNVIKLDEIRFIPCSGAAAKDVIKMKNEINNTSFVSVKAFSDETNAVPASAISYLPNMTTIRFFDAGDEEKAIAFKKFLITKGYSSSLISVENMVPVMNKLYPGYMEIWMK